MKIFCKKGCGQAVWFDEKYMKNGKKIPLEEGSFKTHDCPNSEFNKKHLVSGGQKVIQYCSNCGEKMYVRFKDDLTVESWWCVRCMK